MSEVGDGRTQLASGSGASLSGFATRKRRWWYLARMMAFAGLLVSQLVGLASQRTGDAVRLRVAVIVLAGVFLIATTVDYVNGRKGL